MLIIDFLVFEFMINSFENVKEIKKVFSPIGSIFPLKFVFCDEQLSMGRSVIGLILCP